MISWLAKAIPDGAGPSEDSTMKRYALSRWRDIFAYAVFSAFFLSVIYTTLRPHIDNTLTWIANGFSFFYRVDLLLGLAACFFVCVLPLALILHSQIGIRARHWRKVLVQPPLPIAAIFSAILLDLIIVNTQTTVSMPLTVGISSLLVFAYLGDLIIPPGVAFLKWLLFKKEAASTHKPADGILELWPAFTVEQRDFIHWCFDDRPIENKEDDRFGNAHYAAHIAETIHAQPHIGVGIIGPYGSGKSTLINLIHKELSVIGNKQQSNLRDQQNETKDNRLNSFLAEMKLKDYKRLFRTHYEQVNISCWGFANARVVEEHVLARIIEVAKEYVDCIGIRGFPKQYAEIFSAAQPNFEWITKLIIRNRTAEDMLCEINKTLEIADIQILLAIEDLDRTGGAFDHSEVAALLSVIKKNCSRVTILLASNRFAIASKSSNDKAEFDLHKLCDINIDLSNINPDFAFRCFKLVRSICQSFPDGATNPYTFDFDENTEDAWNKEVLHNSIGEPTWIHYLIMLLPSVRVAKSVFARTIRTWKKLCGEVDFEELLIVSALQDCFPPGIECIKELRRLMQTAGINYKEGKSPIEEFDRIISAVTKNSPEIHPAIIGLFSVLFDSEEFSPTQVEKTGATEKRRFESTVRGLSRPPGFSDRNLRFGQRVMRPGKTDYWNRILLMLPPKSGLGDQDYLKELNAFNNTRNADRSFAIKLIRDPLWTDKLHQFKDFINHEDLKRLLFQVIDKCLEIDGPEALFLSSGVWDAYTILTKLKWTPRELNELQTDIFKYAIKCGIDKSFLFVHDTMEVCIKTSVPEVSIGMRNYLFEVAQKEYGSKVRADCLNACLSKNAYYALRYLVQGGSRQPNLNHLIDHYGNVVGPEAWQFIAPALCEALQGEYAVNILPHFSTLIIQYLGPIDSFDNFIVDWNFIGKMFSLEQATEIIRILADAKKDESYSDDTWRLIEKVKQDSIEKKQQIEPHRA